MTSREIFRLTSNKLGFDVRTKTRKRKYIYGRAVANKLSRVFTYESLEDIGKNTGKDHASVLHSVKNFDDVYISQNEPIDVLAIYNSIYRVCKQLKNVEIEEFGSEEELEKREIIAELKSKIAHLKKITIGQRTAYTQLMRKKAELTHPLLSYLHEIPEEHIETVKVKLEAIVKCLPKKISV